jgi:hypothetical protein
MRLPPLIRKDSTAQPGCALPIERHRRTFHFARQVANTILGKREALDRRAEKTETVVS